MLNEPKTMMDIHTIQEKIYEEQKNMSNQKKLEALHLEAKKAEEKFGINLRRLVSSRT